MIKLHQEIGYSRNVINSYNKAADLLILFLETHGYRYNPEIAMAWFRTVRGRFGSSQDVVNRTLCMISEYCRLSTITLDKLYRMKPSAFSQLPGGAEMPLTHISISNRMRDGQNPPWT